METDVPGHDLCSEVVVDLVVQGRVNITGEIADGGPRLRGRVRISRYFNSVRERTRYSVLRGNTPALRDYAQERFRAPAAVVA